MTEAILYLDTNAFIQLRDLKDLPSRGLLPGVSRVVLVVARTVVDELDAHKTGTSARRRDRARAALRLIDAASEAPDRSLALRREPMEVILTIAPRRRVDWAALGLDPAEPDDRIVAAAASHPGAAVLSHDSGPRIAARDIGVPAHAPPDTWLLPPERTDDQRRLAEAERQLASLLDARPNVSVAFESADEQGSVTLRRFLLPALDGDRVRRLAAAHTAAHPMADVRADDDDGPFRMYSGGPNSFDVSQYEGEYAGFVTRPGGGSPSCTPRSPHARSSGPLGSCWRTLDRPRRRAWSSHGGWTAGRRCSRARARRTHSSGQ